MAVSTEDLRSIFLFTKLDDAELKQVADIVIPRDYAPGATVFAQGHPSPGLWIVGRGRVRLYRAAPSGREFTLCLARRDCLPCMGACPLFDGDFSPASAQALELTTIYFIPRERALETAQKDRALARVFARVLAAHYRHLAHLSTNLALRCSTPRLIDWLLTYANDAGRVTARGVEVNLNVNQDVLASILGATRQMLAQDFLKLERAGVLDARGKRIVIPNLDRLAQMM